jgi:uncharacterized protein
MVQVRWKGLEADSTEICDVVESSEGIHVDSVIETDFGTCTYSLIADEKWQFRSLTMSLASRSLQIHYDGRMWLVDGTERHDLNLALEVDITASPLTNTLPIRRLRLPIGGSADITTAYVSVPDLTVVTDPQRYTRLTDHEYRFESRDSDFEQTISVDEQGLVVTYPGLFVRDAH